MQKNIRKIVIAALFAAMITVATYIIRIPFVGGYINFGDILVILSGWIAGPFYGALAAAAGSAIADFMAGYITYIPATFVIKGLVAFASYFVYRKLANKSGMIVSALIGEIIMVLGYFAFEGVLLGLGWGALASVPYNLIQGTLSFAGAVLIFSPLRKNAYLAREIHVLKD